MVAKHLMVAKAATNSCLENITATLIRLRREMRSRNLAHLTFERDANSGYVTSGECAMESNYTNVV